MDIKSLLSQFEANFDTDNLGNMSEEDIAKIIQNPSAFNLPPREISRF